MIRIFYCNSTSNEIPNGISGHRKEKILSAKKDKEAMINTACTLAAGFASFGINESDVIYSFSENGKPFASNFKDLHFSISHSGNFSIVAFSDETIGIDCENSAKIISPEIASRYFSKAECNAFSDNLLPLWTAKEAFVKYTGKGFALGRNELEIPYFDDEITVNGVWLKRLQIEGCEIAICSGAPDKIEITQI